MADTRVQAPLQQRFSDLYVERALLGHILHDREIPEALRFLEPGDFYDSLNRAIYAAMRAVQDRDQGVDFARVRDQMRRDRTGNDLELAGGMFYLYACMDLYPALGRGPIYARRIDDLAGKRGA
jgi:replicative DNA helicase